MSINSARIVCTGCDYKTSEVYRPILIRYHRASGEPIETGRSKGWCFECAGYSDIEKMDQGELHDSLVSKERERLEVHARLAELERGLFSRFRHRRERERSQYELRRLEGGITELEILLEIARSRRAKARCLSCWSDKTFPISFSLDDDVANKFKHTCGGNLRIIRDRSGNRYHFRKKTYVLNEEGELLGEE